MKYFVFSIKIIFFFFSLYTIYYILYTEKASAQAFSLGVYPPLIHIEAKPPASIRTPVTLHNLGDDPVRLQILFKPFTAHDSEDGHIAYLSEEEVNLFRNPRIFERVQILDGNREVKIITLSPSQKKTFFLHIGLPKDEPASDYYFSLIFISNPLYSYGIQPEILKESNNSQIPAGIATNVLLSIGPKTKPHAKIEEFSTPFFLSKGPVPFTVRLKNLGDSVLTPKGTILVTNMFGQTIGKVDLLPVNILAQTTRAIPDKKSISEIKTQTMPKKAMWTENFLLGAYTATLNIALSENGPLLINKIYFVSFPFELFVSIVIIISITLVIRKRLKKRLAH